MAVLKEILFNNYVDFCGRRETPAGVRDRGDPAGALAPRRLPEPPAESEAPRDRQRPPVPARTIPGSIP
ncbi:hypothetical protein [Neobacillus niacini]|uniref:hypothetical protein n=1 Tax=Neobacillus niacini TaxID=86668 RepID=UPI0030008F41